MLEILREPEVLQLLNISRATARRLRKAGKLGFCRYGGKVVYLPRHVDAFLQAHETKATVEGYEEEPLRLLKTG